MDTENEAVGELIPVTAKDPIVSVPCLTAPAILRVKDEPNSVSCRNRLPEILVAGKVIVTIASGLRSPKMLVFGMEG